MKKRKRTVIRTETCERILIRGRANGSTLRGNSDGSVAKSNPDAKYRLEIYRIEAEEKQSIFECEYTGTIRVAETETTAALDSEFDEASTVSPKQKNRR
jgi:hypothetical protein